MVSKILTADVEKQIDFSKFENESGESIFENATNRDTTDDEAFETEEDEEEAEEGEVAAEVDEVDLSRSTQEIEN